MNDILLSVIVPVYNVEQYLSTCIESICAQTYKNLEIIIVDDGSTDNSLNIILEKAKHDNRIKIVQKENGGQLNARKAGIRAATGMYVTSVDADDWIESDRFMNLVSAGLTSLPDMVHMEGYFKEYENESQYVCHRKGHSRYDKERINTELMGLFAGKDIFLERELEFGHWQWCIRREIYANNVLKIDENIRRIEDFISIFSCVLDSNTIECIDECGYHYRQRDGSINRRTVNWNENHANIYYAQAKKIIAMHNMTEDALNVMKQYVYHNIFLTNYKKVYRYYAGYLFPFLEVKEGSQVIIYGAGNIGVEIVNAIDEEPRYEVVAWVDKRATNNLRSNHSVEDISIIKTSMFDYIVVAILDAKISREVRNDLIDEGVPQEKIALMNTLPMTMPDLEHILG